jgi:hypothetical protein
VQTVGTILAELDKNTNIHNKVEVRRGSSLVFLFVIPMPSSRLRKLAAFSTISLGKSCIRVWKSLAEFLVIALAGTKALLLLSINNIADRPVEIANVLFLILLFLIQQGPAHD